jgi:hypothetical protein
MAQDTTQTLVLTIGAEDLQRIRAAGLRIILARAVGAEAPVVVWQSLDPFQLNTVTWPRDAWALYAATTALAAGNRVLPIALLPEAQAGYYYTFTSGAAFSGPYFSAGIPGDQYGVQNAMPHASYPQLTFGLALAVEINGTPVAASPASAVEVLATRMILLAPAYTVYVWLDTQLTSAMVVPRIGPDAVALDYATADEHALVYDPDLGRFIPEPPPPGDLAGPSESPEGGE